MLILDIPSDKFSLKLFTLFLTEIIIELDLLELILILEIMNLNQDLNLQKLINHQWTKHK